MDTSSREEGALLACRYRPHNLYYSEHSFECQEQIAGLVYRTRPQVKAAPRARLWLQGLERGCTISGCPVIGWQHDTQPPSPPQRWPQASRFSPCPEGKGKRDRGKGEPRPHGKHALAIPYSPGGRARSKRPLAAASAPPRGEEQESVGAVSSTLPFHIARRHVKAVGRWRAMG